MLRRSTLVLLVVAISSGGCTAGIATARILSARQVVLDARDKGADAIAPYEYQLAVRSLDKAVEESGDAQYRTSVELADAARGWAERAIARSGGRDVTELEEDVEALDDTVPDPLFEDGEAPTRGEERTSRPERPEPAEEDEEEFEDFIDEIPEDEAAPWEGDP